MVEERERGTVGGHVEIVIVSEGYGLRVRVAGAEERPSVGGRWHCKDRLEYFERGRKTVALFIKDERTILHTSCSEEVYIFGTRELLRCLVYGFCIVL